MRTITIPMDLAIHIFVLLRQILTAKRKGLDLDFNEELCENYSQILYELMCENQPELTRNKNDHN